MYRVCWLRCYQCLTLQPSQVMAPKWYPEEGAPHTLHGILPISADILVPPKENKKISPILIPTDFIDIIMIIGPTSSVFIEPCHPSHQTQNLCINVIQMFWPGSHKLNQQTHAGLLSTHRLRQWNNNKPALAQRLVCCVSDEHNEV